MKKLDELLVILENQGIKPATFERKVGLANGYLKNTGKRNSDLSLKILDKIKSNDPKIYDLLVPIGSDVLDKIETESTLDMNFLEQRRQQKNSNNEHIFLVPLVPIKAQAGYVRAYDQETYIDTLEKYALPPGVNPRGAIWRYWEIQGHSMEPEFKQGDMLLTSQVHQMDWENLRNFYAYVIVTDQAVLFKRVFCKNALEWVLISENEAEYPQQPLPVEFVKEVWVVRRVIKNKLPPIKQFEIKI